MNDARSADTSNLAAKRDCITLKAETGNLDNNKLATVPSALNKSKTNIGIRKNIFACLFSNHNTISLSRHEQEFLSGLRFERYFSHHRAT